MYVFQCSSAIMLCVSLRAKCYEDNVYPKNMKNAGRLAYAPETQ